MKKLFSILIVIILLFCISAPAVSAQNTPYLPENTPIFIKSAINCGKLAYTELLAFKLELYSRLYSALMNVETAVDMSDMNLDWKDENHQEIFSCVNFIVANTPALYYSFGLTTGCSPAYNYNTNEWYIESVTFDYDGIDLQTLKNRIAETQNIVSSIARKVPSNISDIGKMLWVHDYLAVNYEYDTTLQIRSAYGFLTQNKGVCSSYAQVFCAVMTQLGIPATSVYSDEGNHQWNTVLLNGNFYHIDCTWGDPTPDSYGTAYHNFFLLSDSQLDIADSNSQNSGSHINDYIMESEYFGLDFNCKDKSYDNGYIWNNIKTEIPYYNGEFYFICDTTTNKYEPCATIYKSSDLKTKQEVTTVKSDLWYINKTNTGYSYHPGYYTGFEIIGSQIYFNDSHSVRYYDLSNNKEGKVFETGDNNIFSFKYLSNGDFIYETHTHDDAHKTLKITVSLSDKGHIFDSSAQGYTSDLTALRKYLLGYREDNICLVKGDLSGNDSIINIQDFVALKKLAAQS